MLNPYYTPPHAFFAIKYNKLMILFIAKTAIAVIAATDTTQTAVINTICPLHTKGAAA